MRQSTEPDTIDRRLPRTQAMIGLAAIAALVAIRMGFVKGGN